MNVRWIEVVQWVLIIYLVMMDWLDYKWRQAVVRWVSDLNRQIRQVYKVIEIIDQKQNQNIKNLQESTDATERRDRDQ